MTTREFIEKVGLSTGMQETISQCTSPEAAYAYAKKEGLTDSQEQFLEVMQKVKVASSEMTEADVDSVTGGTDTGELADANTSAIITASATAAAAAACGL